MVDAEKQRGRVLKERKVNDMAIDINRELEMMIFDENSNFGHNNLFNRKN